MPTALRIVTWNIHKGIGGVDRKYRPERIIEVLSHHEPDLVLLQEVDEGAPRSGLHRQVDLIADGLGFRYRCFGPNVALSRGRYGNAIVSRHPISESHNINLTVAPKKRRGALHARVKLTIDGRVRSLAVFNVHLGLAGFERKIQLKRLLANSTFRSLRAATPCVLGGDFNDVWSNLGARLLEHAGLRRVGGPIHTYPAFLPARPLDALYVGGEIEAVRIASSRMALSRQASDHLPLIADLQLPGE